MNDIMPLSVLVIENHPMMREAVCTAISDEADLELVEPDTAGAESFSLSIMHDVLFFTAKPDIILLALGNPGMDELGALKALRESWPEIPVMAWISDEVPGQEQAALQAGACAVLTKSAPRDDIIRALRNLRKKEADAMKDE